MSTFQDEPIEVKKLSFNYNSLAGPWSNQVEYTVPAGRRALVFIQFLSVQAGNSTGQNISFRYPQGQGVVAADSNSHKNYSPVNGWFAGFGTPDLTELSDEINNGIPMYAGDTIETTLPSSSGGVLKLDAVILEYAA